MDNRVEHLTDLGLVNYVQHPTNSNYIVFRFADLPRANEFEKMLTENNIWFERSQERGRTRLFYLFGVHYRDFKTVQSFNFTVEAKHRSFLIKNTFLRWIVVLFTISLCTLAIVGYCKAPEKVQEKRGAYNIQQIHKLNATSVRYYNL
jgi:hypothetical protein